MALARILAVAFLLVTPCHQLFAETAKAQIDGPTQSKAGNMVVLNTVASKAEELRWIIPDELEGRYIQIGTQLAFSVRDSGEFKFYLIAAVNNPSEAAPGKIDIDVASHTVTITDGFGECPPTDPVDPVDPIDPDPTDPPPVTDFAVLTRLSKDAASSLADPTTARGLSDALKQIQVGDLTEMRKVSSATIEAVFLMRRGPSEGKAWDTVWRRPLDAEVAKLEISTGESYQKALQAIAAGLDESLSSMPAPSPSPVPEPKPSGVQITFYTQGDTCVWCKRWKAEVKPTADAVPGWTVTTAPTTGEAPQFDVRVGNKSQRLVGYQTMESLTATVQALQKP